VSGAPKSLTVVNRKMKFIRLLLSGALSASMLSVIALSPVLSTAANAANAACSLSMSAQNGLVAVPAQAKVFYIDQKQGVDAQ
jgi:hypothetical protein